MKLSLFTSDRSLLTKEFRLVDGEIRKETHASLYSGTAETCEAATPAALLALLEGLSLRQALSTGLLKEGHSAAITTTANPRDGAVARTLEHFHYPEEPGWLLWDFDAATMPQDVADRIEALGGPLRALFHIWPEAEAAPYVIRPSSSGGVSAPGCAELASSGLHGFFLVENVSLSREALVALQTRAWAAGLAWIALSKSGALLVRSIVDVAVGSPERLIFEAPPILVPPVTRNPKPSIVSNATKPVPVPLVGDATMSAAARAEAAARQAIQPEAARVEAAFIESRAQADAQKTGRPIEEARLSVCQMLRGAVLSDDHLLELRDGSMVRVGDLLDAPERYDRLSLPDPIEGLAYGPDKATLLLKRDPIRPDIGPRLVSHAHGAKTVYRFARYEPDVRGSSAATATQAPARGGSGRYTGHGAVPSAPLATPAFLSLYQAEEAIRREVTRWIEAVIEWRRNSVGPPPVAAIAASPGAGKSTVVRIILAEMDLAGFGGDVVWHCPTLRLADEAAAHGVRLRSGGHVTRGRSAINPATGERMCARWHLAEQVAKAGLYVTPTLCKREKPKIRDEQTGELGEAEPILCPHYTSCAYLQQWGSLQPEPQLRFETHSYILRDDDGSGRPVGARVVDEAFWQHLVKIEDLTREDFLAPRKPRTAGTYEQRKRNALDALELPERAREVWQALEIGISPFPDGYTAEELEAFAEAEDPPHVLSADPSRPDAVILDELKAQQGFDPKAGARAAVWRILADCKRRGIDMPERLRIVRAPIEGTSGKEFRDVLRLTYRESAPQGIPLLLLDADLTETILREIYPHATHVAVRLQPNARVIQVCDQTFSKAALTSPYKRAEIAGFLRVLAYHDRLNRARGILTGASLKVARQFFEDAGHDFTGKGREEINSAILRTLLHGSCWLWFGPAGLGLNDYEDVGNGVLIGREELPLQAQQDEGRAFFGDTGGPPLDLIGEEDGANYPQAILPYLMKDGSGWGVAVRAHPDPRIRALQEQHRERASVQLMERLRLARAEVQKLVFVLCSVPLPGLPVDALVRWEDIRPSRLEMAMAEAAEGGGILRLSKAGLAADAPDTFKDAAAAHDWLRAGGRAEIEVIKGGGTPNMNSITGSPPFNPVFFELRLAGQRGQMTPAMAVLPGDVRGMAEAQFGPVAELRIAGPTETPALPSNVIPLFRGGVIDLNLAMTGGTVGKSYSLKAGATQIAELVNLQQYRRMSVDEAEVRKAMLRRRARALRSSRCDALGEAKEHLAIMDEVTWLARAIRQKAA